MLRTLASYFLGDNVQSNDELPPGITTLDDNVGEDDWVFVDEDNEEDNGVVMNKSAAARSCILRENNNSPCLRSYQEQESVNFQEDHRVGRVKEQEDERDVDEEEENLEENKDQVEVEEEDEQVQEENEENFAWENSLIEHPSVYIASQVMQREDKPVQARKVGNARRRRRGGNNNNVNAMTASQQQQQRTPTTTQQQQPPTSTAIAAVVGATATTPNTPSRHLGNHNLAQHQQMQSLDLLDVLKQQQRQGRQKKKKQLHRNSQVHQQLQNKPQRRSDKQQYTRFSRANNDRKSC